MELTAEIASGSLFGALLCFLTASALAVIEVLRGTRHARIPTMLLMAGGFVLETLYLQYQGGMRGRCPITTLPEILIFLGWSTVLIYFVVGPTYRLSLLGVFTAPLMATFVAIGLLSGAVSQTPSLPSSPVDPWLETHASLSLISYGAFALAFVAATMFLIQDRLLKSKSLNQLFYNLPPVCYLANAVRRLVVVGFLLLTIGIAAAFFIREFPGWWKIVLASSVWIAYGSLLIADLRRRLSPGSFCKTSLWIFALPVITLGLLGRR